MFFSNCLYTYTCHLCFESFYENNLKTYSELENNANPPQIGSFNFGHSSSVCSVITNLGFRKDDEALKSDNYEKHKDSRKWRTSVMDPFAGNIYVIVYK